MEVEETKIQSRGNFCRRELVNFSSKHSSRLSHHGGPKNNFNEKTKKKQNPSHRPTFSFRVARGDRAPDQHLPEIPRELAVDVLLGVCEL